MDQAPVEKVFDQPSNVPAPQSAQEEKPIEVPFVQPEHPAKLAILGVLLISVAVFGGILLGRNPHMFSGPKSIAPALSPTPFQSPESTPTVATIGGGDEEEIATVCEKNNGVWLDEFGECESLGRTVCEEQGGQFNECASACRHEEGQVACTEQCIQVCTF